MSAKHSQESRSVTHSVIELGTSLNLTTAAEGIEDEETLIFLRKNGCHLAQGFHIAKPLPLPEVNEWILSHAWECESRRLAELKDLEILDTPVEERFERHTRLARRMFDVSYAVISLVAKNRQWFKSCEGLDTRETPRRASFCTHTIAEGRPLQIPDTHDSDRFRDSPVVNSEPFVRFYAGVPLRGPKGQIVGAFCLMDTRPRNLGHEELERLKTLADLVEQELADGQRGFIDSLTGVLNGAGYDSTARQAINLARRLKLSALSLAVRLDNLDRINSDFGFDHGNSALCQVARILQDVFRKSDVIGRYSGASFRALLINNSESQAEGVIARLRQQFSEFNNRADIYTLECDIRTLPNRMEIYDTTTRKTRRDDEAVVNLVSQ